MSSANRRWSLRGLEQGLGTDYELAFANIGGLGNPGIRTQDVGHGERDGDIGGKDRYVSKLLTFPVNIGAPDELQVEADREAWAMGRLRTLKQAWARSDDDLPLDLRIDHFWSPNVVRFYGRPRVADVDMTAAFSGLVSALCTFACLDPLAYGPEVTETDASTPLIVTPQGDVPTRRVTITVTGNGGLPSITHTQDESRQIVFDTALPAGQLAVLDFWTTTMTVNGVADYPLSTDEWFKLIVGTNTIAFSGCSQLSLTYREAYL